MPARFRRTPSAPAFRLPARPPAHRPARPRARWPRTAFAAALLTALVCVAAACSSGAAQQHGAAVIVDSGGSSAATGLRGDGLSPPVTLSAAAHSTVFRTSTGKKTTLGALQKGSLLLLYFGYTHCPDVCPTTMADLGLALRHLTALDQAHTQVVFVTSDPARDTPAVMRGWLRNFDRSLVRPFIGLTASNARIDAVAKSVGVSISPPVHQPNGTITVQHGAETLAFLHGRASVLWSAGTTPSDYQHDISVLLTKAFST